MFTVLLIEWLTPVTSCVAYIYIKYVADIAYITYNYVNIITLMECNAIMLV